MELPLNDTQNLYLYIFETINDFVDGLKYLYGKNNKVNINELTDNDFNKNGNYILNLLIIQLIT